MRRPLKLTALVTASTLWVGALVWAPSGHLGGFRSPTALTSALVYAAGSLICHQRPERSFHRAGVKLPVCARCFGLYLGGAIGVLAWAGFAGLHREALSRAQRFIGSQGFRRALIVCALPTGIALALAWSGWWDIANLLRSVSALPLGGAIGALIAAFVAGDLSARG